MPSEIVYVASVKNLHAIFERIKGAGAPPRFTIEFLKTLGFGSSTDRSVIGVLKKLGFLTSDGTPTDRYNAYRDSSRSGKALAAGLREGWAEVFLADQKAYQRSSTQLSELFKSVTGKGEAVARKMATTFKSLCEIADWSGSQEVAPELSIQTPEVAPTASDDVRDTATHPSTRSRMTLHHDVHVHLPATSDVSVYTAIFRALKAELLD